MYRKLDVKVWIALLVSFILMPSIIWTYQYIHQRITPDQQNVRIQLKNTYFIFYRILLLQSE